MTILEKIAIVFVSLSWLIFAGVLAVPFVPFERDKFVVAAVIYFISQIVFWAGCAIGGREFMRRFGVVPTLQRWFHR